MVLEIIASAGLTGALLSSLFGFMFRRLESKIDKNNEEEKQRHLEQIEIRVSERELMLAEARISSLVVRKLRNEEVNGELALADEALRAKTDALQGLTRKIAIEYMEGTHDY